MENNANREKNRRGSVIAFSLLLLIMLVVADYCSYLPKTKGYINKLTVTDGGRYGNDEMELGINMAREVDGTTKLVLGDSVSAQLFGGLGLLQDRVKVCTVNQAITMCGQYVLAKEYIKTHPDATDIYLIIYPGTLASTSRRTTSYQYVAMPLIEYGLEDDIDELMMGKLESMFGKVFLKPSVIKYMDYSGINRKIYLYYQLKLEEKENITYPEVSDVTIDYLDKMYQLCKDNDVTLHLASGPICDIEKRHEEEAIIKEVFAETGLDGKFPTYCDSFVYYPAELFLDDEVHFKMEYKNRETLNPIISDIIAQDNSMSGLADVLIE